MFHILPQRQLDPKSNQLYVQTSGKNVRYASGCQHIFLYSSFNGLNHLQSSTNFENNLSVMVLLIITLFFTLSCLSLPTILLEYLGYKRSFITVYSSISIYILSNFYPRFFTIFPAAILSGLGRSILSNQCSLPQRLATIYSKVTIKTEEVALITVYGIFLLIFQLRNTNIKFCLKLF